MSKIEKCCICGCKFIGFGNNPYPLVTDDESRCCDYCNMRLVIPARIAKSYKSIDPHFN